MNKKTNLPRNLVIFILLIILTFYILLKDQDILNIVNIIKSVQIKYVLIGIMCMAIYLLCEAINIKRTLKSLNEKISIIKCIKYALIGFFFSSITPAASGGQPMQIYYMYKDKIEVSKSTLTLLINLASMQVITIGFALISLIFNQQYLNKMLVIFFIIGILLNSTALALLIIGIFSKKLSEWLINVALKILKLCRVKNIEEKREVFETQLKKYQNSAVYVKNNKILLLKTLLTTSIQFLLFYSISYWTYRAFNLSTAGIFEIITMQSVLYATVSGIPSPGAVGVSEGAFIEIFKNVYPQTMISSAVLLSRGINFYLFVLISGVITIVNHVKSSNKNEIIENVDESNLE